jgi:hypothetical protein
MSTYSTNLALELIGTGEQAGVWGTTTNTNLGTLIEQAISGYVTQAVATGTDTTITIPNGSSGVARNMYIELTGTGGASTNLIVPANKKLYFIFNNSTGAVTVKVSGQTGVSVPTGKKMVLVSNGTDIVNGLNYIADFASNSATITHLSATSATITNLTLTSLVISNLSIASANITTLTGSTQTLSGNLTLSGGTANGVLYLNGSKVATSGSALTFDGTNLGVGAASGTSSGYATAPQLLNYSASATNLLNASDTSSIIRSAAYRDTTGGGIISMAKFRGTYASPTVVQSGDTSGRLFFDVWGGSNLRRIAEVGALVDTYTSDTNISGTLYFATSTSGNSSSTEKMRLTAAGDLGIGTASPAAKLDVTGFARTTTGAVFQGASNLASGAGLEVGYNTGSSYSFLQSYDRTGSAYRAIRLVGSTIDFDIANSVKATIDSSGNLGIGTATPGSYLSGTAKLVAYANANSQNSILVRNDSSGASASSAIALNAAGNTWGIEIGSSAKNSNALTFQLDYGGANSTKMTLDTSGNLGLGVTPSAWSGVGSAFELKGNAYIASTSQVLALATNCFFNGSNWIYKSTSNASRYETVFGENRWFTAASGTAGNAISFTQAMTLEADGDLGIGLTTPAARLHVRHESASTTVMTGIYVQNFSFDANTQGGIGFYAADNYNAKVYTLRSGTSAGNLVFATNNGSGTAESNVIERARITSDGYFKAQANSAYISSSGLYHEFVGDSANAYIFRIVNDGNNANRYGMSIQCGADNAAGTNYALVFDDGDGTRQGEITFSGGTTTYGTSSDYRLKENVQPIENALNRLARLRPVKWNWKRNGLESEGFVAHELQEVVPIAVAGEKDAVNENGDPVYQSVGAANVVPLLTKALQEAMARIEQLEADVAALKGN